MANDTQDWASPASILIIMLGLLSFAWKWLSESFKTKREENSGRLELQKAERLTAIKQAVKDGMQEFADRIEDRVHEQLKEYQEENNRRFQEVNDRIDNVLLGKDKK